MQRVRRLPQPEAAPLLWAKIENTLRAEQQREARPRERVSNTRRFLAYALAASLLLGLGGSALWLRAQRTSEASGVLAVSALQRVVEKEKEYEAAIAALERLTAPQLAQTPTELALLYRDRLAIIDAQIAHCRSALAQNPGNAHLRRYMLMALRDKKNTLQELAEQPNI